MTNLGGEGHVVMLSETGFFFFYVSFDRKRKKIFEKRSLTLEKYESNIYLYEGSCAAAAAL